MLDEDEVDDDADVEVNANVRNDAKKGRKNNFQFSKCTAGK